MTTLPQVVRDRLIAVLKDNPDATSGEVAKAIPGMSSSLAFALLCAALREGLVTRQKDHYRPDRWVWRWSARDDG